MIEINWKPDRAELRQFALVWMGGVTLVALVVGYWGWREVGQVPTLFWVLALTGGIVGLAGSVLPGVVRPVYLVWMGVAYPVGWVVSHLALSVLYFGLFTLVAVIMRLSGRDALRRRPPAPGVSLWIRRSGARAPETYFRQF